MIGYVTLGTNDLPRAAALYDELLALIGTKRQNGNRGQSGVYFSIVDLLIRLLRLNLRELHHFPIRADLLDKHLAELRAGAADRIKPEPADPFAHDRIGERLAHFGF